MRQQFLQVSQTDEFFRSISPFLELGAYEVLWAQKGATFKRIAEQFRENLDALPSDLVPHAEAAQMAEWVLQRFKAAGIERWGVRIHRAGEYPAKLRDAAHPVELLYFAGKWELVEAPSLAIVGTRRPSREGLARTRKLVRHAVEDGWTIVSGLAIGIDTEAHDLAMRLGGRTIAVIGTPLSAVYPAENADIQARIARDFLVVSQVPAFRYEQQDWRGNRSFFPERNVTMSALTDATIIIEASNTSGTRTQARAALAQGRKLFILDSCFRNPELSWPHEFARPGAIRFSEYSQICEHLDPLFPKNRRPYSP
jgi:DNA processing protein